MEGTPLKDSEGNSWYFYDDFSDPVCVAPAASSPPSVILASPFSPPSTPEMRSWWGRTLAAVMTRLPPSSSAHCISSPFTLWGSTNRLYQNNATLGLFISSSRVHRRHASQLATDVVSPRFWGTVLQDYCFSSKSGKFPLHQNNKVFQRKQAFPSQKTCFSHS